MRIVSDNYKIDKRLFRSVVVDDKQYYILLRTVMEDSLRNIFEQRDAGIKLYNALLLGYATDIIKSAVAKVMPGKIVENPIGYNSRIVVEPVINEYSIKYVEDFGRDNNYPKLILKREGSNIMKSIGPGKEAWDNAIAWSKLSSPYSDNFKDIIMAVSFNAR